MTWSQDAIRLYEQDLLQKADMLAIGLKGLRAADPVRAAQVLESITERLESVALRDGPVGPVEAGQGGLFLQIVGERQGSGQACSMSSVSSAPPRPVRDQSIAPPASPAGARSSPASPLWRSPGEASP